MGFYGSGVTSTVMNEVNCNSTNVDYAVRCVKCKGFLNLRENEIISVKSHPYARDTKAWHFYNSHTKLYGFVANANDSVVEPKHEGIEAMLNSYQSMIIGIYNDANSTIDVNRRFVFSAVLVYHYINDST
ncbi:hypothetical protein DPMN_033208 [Dreissena polymorpha]|uniref:Uncharacterized protein n=1 Tax=Dreissena polymorpha TaxID=45954 RepID=A0A9D4RIZ2_DREPO|nr:hypothetical protein DPMN_033208 [Dreissena polymorpha]